MGTERTWKTQENTLNTRRSGFRPFRRLTMEARNEVWILLALVAVTSGQQKTPPGVNPQQYQQQQQFQGQPHPGQFQQGMPPPQQGQFQQGMPPPQQGQFQQGM